MVESLADLLQSMLFELFALRERKYDKTLTLPSTNTTSRLTHVIQFQNTERNERSLHLIHIENPLQHIHDFTHVIT
jgi:hypothetical protein